MPVRAGLRRAAFLTAAVTFVTGCMTTPASAARQAQQMNDLGDEINELRNETANLASSVDSLRSVLAKQDTTLARLANATGVQVVK